MNYLTRQESTSWWRKLLAFGGKAILFFAVFAIAIFFALFIFVGNTIHSMVYAVADRLFFVSSGFASIVTGIIILTTAGWLSWQIVKMSMGRATPLHFLALGVLLAITFGFSYLTRHEILGEGKDTTYICLSGKAGGKPSVKKAAVDPVTGLECIPNTKKNHQITQAIIDGDPPPQRLVFTKSQQLDGVFVFKNGTQYLYKSAEIGRDGLPVIYTGLWFDDATGGFLKPAENADLKLIRETLERREQLTAYGAKEEQIRREEEAKRKEKERQAIEAQTETLRQQREAEARKAREEQARLARHEMEIQDELRRIAAEDKIRLRQTVRIGKNGSFTIPSGYHVVSVDGEVWFFTSNGSIRPTKDDFIKYNGRIQARDRGCMWCEGGTIVIEPYADIAPRHRLPANFSTTQHSPPESVQMYSQVSNTDPHLLIEFIGRDAPSAFTFLAGKDDTNRVNPQSRGIRLSGVNLPCDLYTIYVDKGQESGGGVARQSDLCSTTSYLVLPGEIYTIRNRSNQPLYSRNVRSEN